MWPFSQKTTIDRQLTELDSLILRLSDQIKLLDDKITQMHDKFKQIDRIERKIYRGGSATPLEPDGGPATPDPLRELQKLMYQGGNHK